MKVIERLEGYYEAQEIAFGVVYRWCPERVVVECRCGKRATHKRSDLISSDIVCECGANTATIREELVIEELDEDEVIRHPWRYAGDREDAGIPY
ncbi:MAG: hypothetical protein LC751_11565 [Actinobacteria bacterium]|nr:hypothetical protein [Actinomycetota bacterium]MCA1739823.1 hypothetical protein [Actinomycetota bacterium]